LQDWISFRLLLLGVWDRKLQNNTMRMPGITVAGLTSPDADG